ncbi:hypothetical protein BD410DRAFT_841132 [Rickenella mellea]|uniref:Uncharacterized protein n=1 Tax=Rickenella mellea TaxID=50990 RepID=A0A4Y7Q0L9_9AGAM|nr:hypothetical protein BD410DRAFT_841132 [Rickenella mellea]
MVDAEITLEDLLLTNNVPTDIQRSTAQMFLEMNKSSLSEVDADLTRLRVEMARLCLEMTGLRLERDAISDDIHRYETLLSSARRVMNIPELIGEIFLHCILDDVASGKFEDLPRPYYTSYRSDTPLALSHVCRIWRGVALRTPRLWAAFTTATYYQSTIPINLRLSRSRSCPLSFGMHLGEIHSSIYESPVIAALSIHKNRWKNVFLNGHTVKKCLECLRYVSNARDTSFMWEFGT